MYTYRLIPRENIFSIIPLLQVLNDKIPAAVLEERLTEMADSGYECVGAFHEKELIGICGIWILTKYYIGKHIEPDNVIILPDYRGKNIGEEMMEWVYEYAKSKGCVASELNCYTANHGGQKFWSNEGYQILGFHYQKIL